MKTKSWLVGCRPGSSLMGWVGLSSYPLKKINWVESKVDMFLGLFCCWLQVILLDWTFTSVYLSYPLSLSSGLMGLIFKQDVPSASKPEVNRTIPAESLKNPALYRYLRLRLPLEENMLIVRFLSLFFLAYTLSLSLKQSFFFF